MRYSDAVLSLGPIAYWRFGEPSGSVALDKMWGHHGSYVGAVELGVPGAVDDDDTAIGLAGSGWVDILDAGSLSALEGLHPWSIVGWFNQTEFTIERMLFYAITGSPGPIHIRSGPFFTAHRAGVEGYHDGLTPGWHFVALTYDGVSLTTYVDGVMPAALFGTTNPLPSSGDISSITAFTFGAIPGGTLPMIGVEDDWALFDFALSQAQIDYLLVPPASGLSNARSELTEALSPITRVYAEPSGTFATPCVRVHPAAPWLAPSVLAKGQRTQRWEVWAVLGKMDSRANYLQMEGMVSDITHALDALPGWSAIMWERPAPTDMGGALYLAVRGIIETRQEV